MWIDQLSRPVKLIKIVIKWWYIQLHWGWCRCPKHNCRHHQQYNGGRRCQHCLHHPPWEAASNRWRQAIK